MAEPAGLGVCRQTVLLRLVVVTLAVGFGPPSHQVVGSPVVQDAGMGLGSRADGIAGVLMLARPAIRSGTA